MGFMDRMKQAAESAQAATSKVGVGASADQMALANRAKKLMDSGVDTPARIDSMSPTGNTDTPGGSENVIPRPFGPRVARHTRSPSTSTSTRRHPSPQGTT
jgi:hypothetical protein